MPTERDAARPSICHSIVLLTALALAGCAASQAQDKGALPVRSRGFLSDTALDAHAGLGGLGGDLIVGLDQHFNVRAGADLFQYASSFKDDDADIAASVQLQSAHVALDWYPLGGRFRMSPLLVFANSTHAGAAALIPPGSTISLDSKDYISSSSDPLHGQAAVHLRRASPGFSLGFGNSVRRRGRFSFPTEAGFYYVGQPLLQVSFEGTACDPQQSRRIGCIAVLRDPDFKRSLAGFTARMNSNLHYAEFFPIVNTGVGFRF